MMDNSEGNVSEIFKSLKMDSDISNLLKSVITRISDLTIFFSRTLILSLEQLSYNETIDYNDKDNLQSLKLWKENIDYMLDEFTDRMSYNLIELPYHLLSDKGKKMNNSNFVKNEEFVKNPKPSMKDSCCLLKQVVDTIMGNCKFCELDLNQSKITQLSAKCVLKKKSMLMNKFNFNHILKPSPISKVYLIKMDEMFGAQNSSYDFESYSPMPPKINKIAKQQ